MGCLYGLHQTIISYQPNHQSALFNYQFVTEAISELITNRCAKQVQERPVVCSPLMVVTSAEGKLRLVLNLNYLNQFLYRESFKYEDLRIAMLLFDKEDFLLEFDLKSGYHHLDIFEPHQSFLGFSWEVEKERKYFVFRVLLFGLGSACYDFTKLMRPLVRHWRGQGIQVVLYLDNGIAAVKGQESANRVSEQIQQDLARAGFIVNEAKSQWTPTRSVIWLGFQINLALGQLTVSEAKLQSLLGQIHKAKENQSIPARVLASVIGKIIAMSLALGPVTRLMTCSLYAVLNSRLSWWQQLTLSVEAKDELVFWENHM